MFRHFFIFPFVICHFESIRHSILEMEQLGKMKNDKWKRLQSQIYHALQREELPCRIRLN